MCQENRYCLDLRTPMRKRRARRLEATVSAINQPRIEPARKLHGACLRVHLPERLIPVCAWCRRLRKDDSTWVALGPHLTMGTATSFTHTICPECASLWTDQEHG